MWLLRRVESEELGIAAGVVDLRSVKASEGVVHMRQTLVDLIAGEVIPTCLTIKVCRTCDELPVKRLPLNFLYISEVLDELVKVPFLINLMLSSGNAVCIDKVLGIWALLPFALPTCEELGAVDASQQVLLVIFESTFQLLHVQLAPEFVFAVVKSF